MKIVNVPLLSIRRKLQLLMLKCTRNSMSTSCRLREDVLEIFKAAVHSVLPQRLVRDVCRREPTGLKIEDRLFALKHNVYVVGFGKAVLGMASAVEEILGDHIVNGIISVPKGIQQQMKSKPEMLLKSGSKIQVFEGAANNLPDEDSQKAASSISELVSSLKESDVLLVLISGGGSALLPSPLPPVTLAEKQTVVKMMADSGATIQELNTVRKRLSLLKGGGLARLAAPAQVASLILSDIIGDPLDLVASGPTVKNNDDPSLALRVLEKLNLVNKVPESVRHALEETAKTLLQDNGNNVLNVLVGSNAKAADAASSAAIQLGYTPVTATLVLHGVARSVGSHMSRLALSLSRRDLAEANKQCEMLEFSAEVKDRIKDLWRSGSNTDERLCIISAGETVVTVKGRGTGGRNQELALSAALELQSEPEAAVVLLSAGTDGVDGPTNAAGAIAAPSLVKTAEENGLCALEFLENNDSYTFFSKLRNGEWHVTTGHTGTNVMDFVIILIGRNH